MKTGNNWQAKQMNKTNAWLNEQQPKPFRGEVPNAEHLGSRSTFVNGVEFKRDFSLAYLENNKAKVYVRESRVGHPGESVFECPAQ
jgi:hypothetical protein